MEGTTVGHIVAQVDRIGNRSHRLMAGVTEYGEGLVVSTDPALEAWLDFGTVTEHRVSTSPPPSPLVLVSYDDTDSLVAWLRMLPGVVNVRVEGALEPVPTPGCCDGQAFEDTVV